VGIEPAKHRRRNQRSALTVKDFSDCRRNQKGSLSGRAAKIFFILWELITLSRVRDPTEVRSNHNQEGDRRRNPVCRGGRRASARRRIGACTRAFSLEETIEIAMKYALIAASAAAFAAGFGCASAQVNERREAPVAAPGQPAPEGQRGLRTLNILQRLDTTAPSAQAPETTGRSSSRDPGSDSSADDESKSAAEARRVRAAVGRTLDRTHALSQTASD